MEAVSGSFIGRACMQNTNRKRKKERKTERQRYRDEEGRKEKRGSRSFVRFDPSRERECRYCRQKSRLSDSEFFFAEGRKKEREREQKRRFSPPSSSFSVQQSNVCTYMYMYMYVYIHTHKQRACKLLERAAFCRLTKHNLLGSFQ